MSFNVKALENRYYPSGTQRDLVGTDDFARFVERRFWSMTFDRNRWYERAKRVTPLYDVYKDWLLDGENFEKAVRFPTLRDVNKALIDEILRNPPEAELEPDMGENPQRAQALQFKVNDIKNNIYEKRTQEDCLNDMLYWGEGFRMTNYYDVSYFDEDEQKKVTIFNDVGTERIDPRKVYLDESPARYLWDPKKRDIKRDAIIKYIMPRTTFIDMMQEREGVVNLDAVSVNSRPLTGDEETPTTEESITHINSENRNVNAYLYFNQEEQMYGMVANGVTVIEPRTIPNDHHRIPIVNYKFERRRDDVFYGISLAELLAPHIYLQDTLLNLEIMGQKLRLMTPMLMDSDLGYNRKVHKMHPRAVWKLNPLPGKTIQQSVMPMQFGQGDPVGWQNLNNLVESQTTITSGIDRRSLFLSPGELATQTAFKNQSLQKRVNALIFSNEIEAEGQLTELLISDIKQYLPEQIDAEKNGNQIKQFRKVQASGYIVEQNADGDAQFIPSQGTTSYFDLTPEAIDVKVNVKVRNKRERVLLQEAKSARILQFLPVASNIVSVAAQQDPSIMQKLDFAGMIEQAAEALDMDLSRTIKDDSYSEHDGINREHLAMFMGMDVPVPANETYEQTLSHKEQHERLRFIYRDGRLTNEETAAWKGMSPIAKEKWTAHYTETLVNIKNRVLPEPDVAPNAPTPVPPPTAEGGPTQVSQPSPQKEKTFEEKATSKTLLK